MAPQWPATNDLHTDQWPAPHPLCHSSQPVSLPPVFKSQASTAHRCCGLHNSQRGLLVRTWGGGMRPVANFCVQGNEHPGFVKCLEFIDWQSRCWLLREDSGHRFSSLVSNSANCPSPVPTAPTQECCSHSGHYEQYSFLEFGRSLQSASEQCSASIFRVEK